MDTDDIYKGSSSMRASKRQRESFRANSSNIWRNTGIEVFSRSSREEDDEEALKWAALEKLPTFDRLRKGLLFGSKGANEVDVQSIGFQDKRNLVERLVNTVEEDNEKFLLKLRNRIDRVGIDIPTIEVRYEHLNVDAEAYTASRALPTFVNFNINLIEADFAFRPSKFRKTTLLLALAGKLDPTLKTSGRITYNGHGMEEFVPQRTAAYISQHDLHIGEMTVRETLAYSARFQGVGSRYEMLAELSRREKAANIKPDPDVDMYMKAAATEGDEANVVTDYVLKVLGLDICADTLVGDEMIRGISGGTEKACYTGEMLVGPAKALFMDEISTGLDSSTTYQIVNMLRQYVHIMKGTAFISLLQPAPETYDLFDDIVLLADGQMVYQGPRENVLDFFESMGFKCPERKGVADFLQEVTSKKDQKQYWANKDEPYRFIPVSEFAEAFQSFAFGRKLGDELAIPFDKSKSHPAALTKQKYGLGDKELLKACTDRELLLMKRNSFVFYFKIFQLTVMALTAMTVFLRTKMHKDTLEDGGVYTGICSLPPWAYAIPSWILKIPVTFLEVAIWTFLTYYVIGFDPNVGRLMKQYLVLLLVHQSASALFRFIGAAGRNMIVANTFGLFALLMLFALGGIVLSRGCKELVAMGLLVLTVDVCSNAIIVNEFTGNSWSRELENGTKLGVCDGVSRVLPQAYWYWIGVGGLFGFVWLFNIFYLLSLTYLKPFEKPQAVLPEETEDDAQKGGSIRRVSAQVNGSTRRSISSGSSSTRVDAIEANGNRKRGMILPFEPHSITFDDVRYSVDMPAEMKAQGATEDKLELLKGVSGAFRPGVLTALMGVSGAGKTTLMDVLAGRKTGGYIEGNITISGYPKNQATFARISGFVSRTTSILQILVEIASRIDAETKGGHGTRRTYPLRGALVGLPGVNGLSTEQRKRLTIAVELVANPSIIFMDEPTSGLDARAAAVVMRTVRNTVNTGRTVVCTIHQPSIDIFEAFDELFLMKRGGEEIYVGPIGVPKIKDGYNPATWMLEVTTSSQELVLGVDFADQYKGSELYTRNKALIKELSIPRPGTKNLFFPTKYSQSFLTQCIACLWKQHWSYWRNPPYTAVRFLFTTFIALIFGTMFWDLGSKWNTRQDLFNAVGSMYAAINFLGFQYGSTVQPVVAIERTVFYRERAAGMYSALPYAFSQFLIEIPYVFIQSIVYGLIVYSMMGFDWNAEKFFWLYISYSSHYWFIIPRPRIPVWWRWYYWATPFAYTLYGIIVSQFGEIKDQMEGGDETVEEFLRNYFGFRHDMLGMVAAILLGFVVLFTFIFAYSIRTFNFQTR
ncbi:UNVERIFIED_CONTAM: Pleiotropic drug resistance protein 1 [Sesamum angustifolium]|uniref:Pleiotropic drug resistance protein 1 n=1 Tax=Sesamum angustifolium TaxID=2727405 RepID=A0AAW2ISZ2_9LAMI